MSGFAVFSVFFLKESSDENEAYRTLPENHNKLIRGVDQLTRYSDKCPNTLLRFYVSPEVWERLARDGILYRPGTEFCKMASDSETSQLGTIWRSLCLSDTEFEWAIQADCGPDEEWILARIAHWDREKFKSWLSSNFCWGSEFLFWKHNWYTEQHPDNFSEYHDYWNLDNFDFLSAGSIVTRPELMPNIEKFIWKYFQSGYSPCTYYHASENAWSVKHQKFAFIPLWVARICFRSDNMAVFKKNDASAAYNSFPKHRSHKTTQHSREPCHETYCFTAHF